MSEYFRKPIVQTLMLKGQEGQSIKEIKKTGTSGLVDTYTITLTDGTTSTFTVTNGKDGEGMQSLATVATSGSYNDLKDKPTIPTVTNDLTNALKQNYDYAYNAVKADETVTYTKLDEQLKTAVAKTITGTEVDSSSMRVFQKGKLVQVSIRVFLMGSLKVAHNNATISINFGEVGLPKGFKQMQVMDDEVIAKVSKLQAGDTGTLEREEMFYSYDKIAITGFNLIHDSDMHELKFAKTITYIAE